MPGEQSRAQLPEEGRHKQSHSRAQHSGAALLTTKCCNIAPFFATFIPNTRTYTYTHKQPQDPVTFFSGTYDSASLASAVRPAPVGLNSQIEAYAFLIGIGEEPSARVIGHSGDLHTGGGRSTY
jgi:hypothetical protein